MLAKRLIACLDIDNGKTVKGIKFENIVYAGDPVELGKRYSEEGIDELVYLDITASYENKKIFSDLVKEISINLNIPFTVGGGINKPEDAEILLKNGADKISINTIAVKEPKIIETIAKGYGSQFVVVAIDADYINGEWIVFINGGRHNTGRNLFEWAKEVESRGAGEILFTSMQHDGSKNGFATDSIRLLSELLEIPVIASGGAGNMEHFVDVFKNGKADAALAASIFHFNEIKIKDLKTYLNKEGIPVRL